MAAAASYWGVELGSGCRFYGPTLFSRTGHSRLAVGDGCVFRSSLRSNRVGLNRPCMLTTREPGAELVISDGCGLSGTVIAAAESVLVGERVMCGANVTIMDTDWHALERQSGAVPHAPVSIGADVWLGLNVLVLKGVTIGAATVVGAGSIVSDSLPAGVLAAGQPARVIREL